ncbi:MAG: ABC transporter ATP-binding protein [Gammaproteobacteria bacterium CG22_combo_CG10-13_8_21_14_all_40_8]|nr:MAG: ABC transporter ATP-binding protein [Gammaproteobacteria bacterium CG22_combo_CG10-13_8_21_14_all_40_8]
MMIIQCHQLMKSYPGSSPVAALRGISMDVAKGEFIAIEGPSGCGKSTLLSLLGLLDAPTSGNLKLLGEETSSLSFAQRCRLRNQSIGFIFQSFDLLGDLSILDNVILPMRYHPQISRQSYREIALDCLDRVAMAGREKDYPWQLSGGQQQRVAIARALTTQPALILADEPTGNLDSHNAEAIINLLKSLNQQGATIVMVTHNPQYAQQVHRSIQLQDGLIVHEK